MKYLLITDATAGAVERRTGLRGIPTPLGVLVEKPREFQIEAALDKLDSILHPSDPRCTCGRRSIMHRPNCFFAYAVA